MGGDDIGPTGRARKPARPVGHPAAGASVGYMLSRFLAGLAVVAPLRHADVHIARVARPGEPAGRCGSAQDRPQAQSKERDSSMVISDTFCVRVFFC
jgi:hypothetical protein